jgi:anti-sigma regulatory factor (Ser/Thr protein kinase)
MIAPPPGHAAPGAGPDLLVAAFTREDLDEVRHRVQAVSGRHGLRADALSDWVTAVNELMTNAVRHGGGAGRLRLRFDDRLTCEVCDSGAGFAVSGHLGDRPRPALSASGGMGLWIVAQMAEVLSVDSGPGGTAVRIAPAGSPAA